MLIVQQRYRPAAGGPLPRAALHAGTAAFGVVALVIWLQMLGRPFLCDCSTVRFWAPSHDSQHFADWYSLLHLSFGLGLFALVTYFQPRWALSAKLAAAVLGSVAWESIENLPAVIASFNPPAGSQTYQGDTILNALGDTLFVALGCGLAARLSARSVLIAAIVMEIAVWLAIRDGIAIGTVRLALDL